VVAAFVSFLIGTLALGAAVAASPGRLLAPELRAVPWYAWLGGLYGAFFVVVAAFGAPRIGVGPLLTAVIAGQLIGAILLDHYGLLGLSRQPVSPEKLAGAALVLMGAFMVRRG
jgi:transporter family-2 protein